MTNKIAPCLWYDGTAEDAATFYAATFPDSSVDAVHRSPLDTPGSTDGTVLMVEFTVCGMPFLGLNGGPNFPHTQAVSFMVHTDDQPETDRLLDAIVGNGGAENACGWCQVSWQITPRALMAATTNPDKAAAKRGMEAMMTMRRIDIAQIEAAVKGEPA